MGTNYFLIHEKCDCCGRSERLHLGKDSAGWTFSFRGYRNEADPVRITTYEDFKAVVEEHLFRKEAHLEDEYGKRVAWAWLLARIAERRGGTNHTDYCLTKYGPHYDECIWKDEHGNSFREGEFS